MSTAVISVDLKEKSAPKKHLDDMLLKSLAQADRKEAVEPFNFASEWQDYLSKSVKK